MYPEVSQTINIETGEQGTRKHLRATVLDVTEKEIMINYPLDESTNKSHFLMNSEKIAVIFTKESRAEKDLYKFNTTVIKKTNGHIPSIVLQKPDKGEISRIQRRKFLRIPAVFNARISVSSLQGRNDKQEDILISTSNVSAGGFRFSNINFCFEAGTHLQGVLFFEKDETTIIEIQFVGEIVNTTQSPTIENQVEYGVKFKEISKAHEEIIIQYCFKKQIALHKRMRA